MDDYKYVVKKGDSLWKISNDMMEYGKAWPLLFQHNEDEIDDPNFIYPGQVINIPKKWIKPKIKTKSTSRADKISVEKNEKINMVFAYDASDIRPVKLISPFSTITVKFSGKVFMGTPENSSSMLEISNTGVSASSEQKIESSAGELARKIDIKHHRKTKEVSVKSTLTTASFGPSSITVSHSFEYKINGKILYIYEVNLPSKVKGNFSGYKFEAKDFKYIIEIEEDIPISSNDQGNEGPMLLSEGGRSNFLEEESFRISGKDVVIIVGIIAVGFISWELLAIVASTSLAASVATAGQKKPEKINFDPIYVKAKKITKKTSIEARN